MIYSELTNEILVALTKVLAESDEDEKEVQRNLLTYLRSPLNDDNSPRFPESALIQAVVELISRPTKDVTPELITIIRGELDLIEKAKTSFEHFYQYILGLIPSAHHIYIARRCQALMDNFDYDDLNINTPPGSAKSTVCANAFVTFCLCRKRDTQVLLLCNTASRADHWGRIIRNNIAAAPSRIIYPNVNLQQDSKAANKFSLSNGSVFEGGGGDMAILGIRAGLIVCDDIVKSPDDAQSIEQMLKLEQRWEQAILTRLLPRGKTININQRLSDMDITAILQNRAYKGDGRRLDHVVIRMEAEADDVLGRPVGERLWNDWFTEQDVIDHKRDGHTWSTIWQQNPPSKDGAWIDASLCQIVDRTPHFSELQFYICGDLANSDNKGDYSVLIPVGIHPADGRVYIMGLWKAQTSDHALIAHDLCDMVNTYRPYQVLFDDDALAKQLRGTVEMVLRERKEPPFFLNLIPIQGKSKEVRASSLRALFKRRLVFFERGEWNAFVISQLLKFPFAQGSGVDDCVDSLALIGKRQQQIMRVIEPTKEPELPKTFNSIPLGSGWVDEAGNSWEDLEKEVNNNQLRGRIPRIGGSVLNDGLEPLGRDRFGRTMPIVR